MLEIGILKARQFARQKHGKQTRLSGDFFFTHPERVADRLATLGFDEDTICAGYLHDVVEDTATTIDDIHKHFNEDIAHMVAAVTKFRKGTFIPPIMIDDTMPVDWPHKANARLMLYTEKLLRASVRNPGALAIKAADQCDNVSDIAGLEPEAIRTLLRILKYVYLPLFKEGREIFEAKAPNLKPSFDKLIDELLIHQQQGIEFLKHYRHGAHAIADFEFAKTATLEELVPKGALDKANDAWAFGERE